MKKEKKATCVGDFIVTDLGNDVINIAVPPFGFQQYLVKGRERAILIDTGFGFYSMKKIVDSLTDLPIILVNTHAHPDHSGGNAEFGSPYLHPLDNEVYGVKCSLEARLEEATKDMGVENAAQLLQPSPPEPIAMEDGQLFQLGERALQVIHTPGHTRGSVCLLDDKTGILFSGDTVQNTPAALLGQYATTISTYITTLEKLKTYPIKAICPGHRDTLLPPDLIDKKLQCAKYILDGNRGELIDSREGPAYEVTLDGAAIRYSLEKFG